MFLRESERRSNGMWRYSVSRITDGACISILCECSMCPLCSSMRATPLKIITTARRSVHTLMGSNEAFSTKTRAFILESILREPKGQCQKTVSECINSSRRGCRLILIDRDAVVCYKSVLFHVVAHVHVSPRDTGDFPHRRNPDSADDDDDDPGPRATAGIDYGPPPPRQSRCRDRRD